MMPLPLRPAVVLAVVLLVSACASSNDGSDQATAGPAPTTPATASATAGGTASPAPSRGGDAALPADLRTRPVVAAAIADTASREKVTPAEVVIAAWSPVTWNDGSLGCPQEGMSYTQALVDGELLMLRVGTGLFQYHATTGGPFTYCADPSASYTVGG
jgi:hypothetical protein